jgi:(p)ppGpp synthase/HD superfamily hydrolase
VIDCGENVASIVKHVTEPLDPNKEDADQLPWLTRKEAYLKNLKQGDKRSAVVSAADKIHNTESFLEDIKREGEAFNLRFGSSIANRLWFHEQVLLIVEEKLGMDHPLCVRLKSSTYTFKSLLG